MSFITDLLDSGKQVAAESAVRRYLAGKIASYGELQEFTLDLKQKTMEIQVLLEGESSSITLRVDGYQMLKKGDDTYLIIKKLDASRKWLLLLLNDLVVEKTIPVPNEYATLLKMVL